MAIQSTQCECPRGDHKCSHAAALYVYGIHNLSRTDVECQWKRKKSDLPTTSAAAEMFPNIPYRPLSRLPNEEDRSFLYKELKGHSGHFCLKIFFLRNHSETTLAIFKNFFALILIFFGQEIVRYSQVFFPLD